MTKITNRLKLLAENIKDNSKVIDIGCDHAYLSIYLAKTKKNIHIIASDINECAYNIAKRNVSEEKLESQIEVRLGNGLKVAKKEELDTIVLAGLGTMTIIGILKNDIDKLKYVDTLIIQSNTDLISLRKNVISLGYYIYDEKIVLENNIYYTIITFKKGYKKYNKKELLFGPILINKKEKLFQNKIKNEYQKLLIIYNNLPISHIIKRIKIKIKIKKYQQFM